MSKTEISIDSRDALHFQEDLFLSQFSLPHDLPNCLNQKLRISFNSLKIKKKKLHLITICNYILFSYMFIVLWIVSSIMVRNLFVSL